jgi:hypothetical protein
VPYEYSLEDLLVLLHAAAPTKADAVTISRRRVEHGLLSVGVKIHCLDNGEQFDTLVEALGGKGKILEVNHYKRSNASLCLVLPPVGNARTAIWLLEALETATASKLFNNPRIQVQVCSPGRLSARFGALLSIAFYLGSDFLRRYALEDLETTFSESAHWHLRRGRRIIIYDAGGTFERDFKWWGRAADVLVVQSLLPFEDGRSDIIACTSRRDVENVNLIATLLMHSQYGGYWGPLGTQFAHDLDQILQRHVLSGLLDAPWLVTPDWKEGDDALFFSAFQELMQYAFSEYQRVQKQAQAFWRKPKPPSGILWEVKTLLERYRGELIKQSETLEKGESA